MKNVRVHRLCSVVLARLTSPCWKPKKICRVNLRSRHILDTRLVLVIWIVWLLCSIAKCALLQRTRIDTPEIRLLRVNDAMAESGPNGHGRNTNIKTMLKFSTGFGCDKYIARCMQMNIIISNFVTFCCCAAEHHVESVTLRRKTITYENEWRERS